MTQSENIMNKWAPILESIGVTRSKADWLSKYMKVAAKTVGLDLVSVQPMSGPGGTSHEEMDRIKAEIKAENRGGKIDSILEGKEFKEKDISEHPDYKGPVPNLFYLD